MHTTCAKLWLRGPPTTSSSRRLGARYPRAGTTLVSGVIVRKKPAQVLCPGTREQGAGGSDSIPKAFAGQPYDLYVDNCVANAQPMSSLDFPSFVPNETLELLTVKATSETVKAGSVIQEAGEPIEIVILVQSGALALSRGSDISGACRSVHQLVCRLSDPATIVS